MCNDAGSQLMTFLNLNNATVCNTWFDKQPVYKGSWHHPSTKQWHSIDFVIVHQRDRKFCQDCRVVRTADCGSDHRMVCSTFLFQELRFSRRVKTSRRPRYNVGLLKSVLGGQKMRRTLFSKSSNHFVTLSQLACSPMSPLNHLEQKQ